VFCRGRRCFRQKVEVWMFMEQTTSKCLKGTPRKPRKSEPSSGDRWPPNPLSEIADTKEKVFSVVGIGASAGRLEAMTQILHAFSPNTGMAFVLVQHLEARHESMLSKLLSSATRMPVAEVVQGTPARPDHMYVIPPNVDISIVKGVLHLARR